VLALDPSCSYGLHEMRALRYGLLLSLACLPACYESNEPRDGNESDAAQSLEPDSAAPADEGTRVADRCKRFRLAEQDDVTLCLGSPLEDYCKKFVMTDSRCPMNIDDAISMSCINQGERPAYYLDCNACGGMNVRVPRGWGSVDFTFGADGVLIGMHIANLNRESCAGTTTLGRYCFAGETMQPHDAPECTGPVPHVY
jgi:hypothetical protein